MNKRDAAQAVHHLTARSLRALAKRSSQWESMGLPKDMTEHQRTKIGGAMLELADKLEAKYPSRVIEAAPTEEVKA